LIDAAVAQIEEIAAENPESAQAQSDLGSAYIQKIFDSSNDLQKGLFSMKADKQYDKALELDPQHWEARFSKAVNWSFNPPIMGLQPKAIEQFEILRGQQEQQEPQPHFAETYFYLGNLYTNTGKPAQAAQVWSRGAELFPDNAKLQAKAKEAPSPTPSD